MSANRKSGPSAYADRPLFTIVCQFLRARFCAFLPHLLPPRGDNLRSLFRFPPRTKGVAPHYGLAGTFFPGGDLGTDAEERDFKKAKQSIQRTQPSPVPSPSLHRCFGQQYSPQLNCKFLRWPVVTTFFRHTPDSSRLSILRFSPRPHFMGKSTAEDAWQRTTTSRMYLLSVHRGVVPSQPSRIGACGRHSG